MFGFEMKNGQPARFGLRRTGGAPLKLDSIVNRVARQESLVEFVSGSAGDSEPAGRVR